MSDKLKSLFEPAAQAAPEGIARKGPKLTTQFEFTSEGILSMGVVPGLEALRDHLEKVTIYYAQQMCNRGDKLTGASYLLACHVLAAAGSEVISREELIKLTGLRDGLVMMIHEPEPNMVRLRVDIDEVFTLTALLEDRAAKRWQPTPADR